MSFLKKLFTGNTTLGVSRSLLFNCKHHASLDPWYAASKGWVSPDFRSKHSLLVLHVWMVHKRLLAVRGKAGLRVQECLFDELWEDTGMRIRQMGIPELSVNKYLSEVQGYSFKTCVELDEAQGKAQPDQRHEELAGALWRSVYNKRDEVDEQTVLEMASYVQAETSSLAALPDPALLDGRISFSPPPGFAHNAAKGGDKAKTLATPIDALKGGGDGSDEWQEAFSSSGKVYWFNTRTRETTWVKPDEV